MNQPTPISLQEAQALHSAGRLAEAEQAYAQLLQANPNSFDAWYLSGVLALQTGRHPKAVARLERAASLRGNAAPCFLNLGLAYQGVGRLQDSRVALEKASALDPKLPEAHNSLGVILQALGHRDEAEAAFRRAIALRPTYGRASYNLGNALKDAGRLVDAVAAFREAARHEPQLPPVHANLGVVLQDLGDRDGAADAYQRALVLDPHDRETTNNLGTLRREQGELELAAELFVKLIAAHPTFAEAYLNLGSVRHAQERYDDALAAFQRALSHGAARDAVFYNIGLAYDRTGDSERGLAAYAEALRAKPEHTDAKVNHAVLHLNKASLHLMRGEYAEGWRDYEHRWGTPSFQGRYRPFSQPRWDGRRELPGALVVCGEQGVGDEIIYGRMAGELAASGMNVIFEMDARLVPLYARSYPGLRPVARYTPPRPGVPDSDIAAHIPVASLGQFLRAEPGAFPAERSYLRPDAVRVADFRRRLMVDDAGAPVVGISWISKNREIGTQKSTALAAWGPILRIPGVRFVDLQYGDTAVERAEVEQTLGASITHLPDLDLHNDLDGLAALISACDLVITVSNTTAHLAGAVGTPTWVFVPADKGRLWYWGEKGAQTPWYPSVRLFRQRVTGDWNEAVANAARDLREGAWRVT